MVRGSLEDDLKEPSSIGKVYLKRYVPGKKIYLHRPILELLVKKIPLQHYNLKGSHKIANQTSNACGNKCIDFIPGLLLLAAKKRVVSC